MDVEWFRGSPLEMAQRVGLDPQLSVGDILFSVFATHLQLPRHDTQFRAHFYIRTSLLTIQYVKVRYGILISPAIPVCCSSALQSIVITLLPSLGHCQSEPGQTKTRQLQTRQSSAACLPSDNGDNGHAGTLSTITPDSRVSAGGARCAGIGLARPSAMNHASA